MRFLKKLTLITWCELVLLLGTSWYNYHLFATAKLVGNGASRALVALGPMLGIGAPYKDLYEFAPPGYFMLLAGWAQIWGTSMPAFRLLHATLVFVHGLCFLLICKKLFPSQWLAMGVFAFGIIAAHSRIVQSDIFSVDLAATAFALAGLAALLYVKNVSVRLLLSSALLLLAAQMKDIYILVVVTLLPIYLREILQRSEWQFYKTLLISLVGPGLILFAAWSYLQINDALPSYVEVVKDKSVVAYKYDSWRAYYVINSALLLHFNNFFIRYGLIAEVIFVMLNAAVLVRYWILQIFHINEWYRTWLADTLRAWQQALNNYAETIVGARVAVGIFVFSLLGGLTLYGQHTVDTRFIPVTTCLYLLIGLLLVGPMEFVARRLSQKWLKAALFVGTMILISPKQQVLSHYRQGFPNPPPYNFELDQEILSRTSPEDCILHLYGWEVSSTYMYTRRRPCTKYFLVNHVYLFGKRRIIREYQQQIFSNPPAVVLINTKGADFNIAQFESEILAVPRFLEHCYTADPRYQEYEGYFMAPVSVYWPRSELTKEQLGACVLEFGKI